MKNQKRKNLKLIRMKKNRTSKLSSKKLLIPNRSPKATSAKQMKMESLKSNLKTLTDKPPLAMKIWIASQNLS